MYVLIAMAMGALVTGSFLEYLSTTFKVTNVNRANLAEYYAAEAAVQAVVRDLVSGVDALSGSYTPPTVTENGYTVTPSVSAPTATEPPRVYYYVDPGAAAGLQTVAGHITYNFQMDSVQAGSYIQVNWAFSPENRRWRLALYKGPIGSTTLVVERVGSMSPAQLAVDGGLVVGGTYTMAFTNETGSTLTTVSYNAQGGDAFTWVYGLMEKDYIIVAEAGATRLTVHARQVPGPVSPNMRQRVTLEYLSPVFNLTPTPTPTP